MGEAPDEVSRDRQLLLARDAIEWLVILRGLRSPLPLPNLEAGDNRARLTKRLRYQLEMNQQAYAITGALNQVNLRVRRLTVLPPELRQLADAFLSSCKAMRLTDLRNGLEHRDDYLAGTAQDWQAERTQDTWTEHEEAVALGGNTTFAAGSEEVFEATKLSIAVRFDEVGVTGIYSLGRNYWLKDAFDRGAALGPPLGRWAGSFYADLL